MTKELTKLGIEKFKFLTYPRYDSNKSTYPVKGQQYVIDALSYDNHLGVLFSHLLTIKWWYEHTAEDVCTIMEDDVDFSTIEYWNFSYVEFMEKLGTRWDVVQLCASFQFPFAMYPRVRTDMDNGAVCYIIKRCYAKKLIDYYFDENGGFNVKHPVQYSRNRLPFKDYAPYDSTVSDIVEASEFYQNYGRISTENLIYGIGLVYVFCLFNHNVEFKTTNHIDSKKRLKNQVKFQKRSHDYIKEWWVETGSKGSLGDIFNFDWACSNHEYYNVLHIDN